MIKRYSIVLASVLLAVNVHAAKPSDLLFPTIDAALEKGTLVDQCQKSHSAQYGNGDSRKWSEGWQERVAVYCLMVIQEYSLTAYHASDIDGYVEAFHKNCQHDN